MPQVTGVTPSVGRWAASRFPDRLVCVDSRGELPVLELVANLFGGLVAEFGVASAGIVAEFDVSGHVVAGAFPGRVDRAVNSLVLQRGEEGFGECVVVADAGAPDRPTDQGYCVFGLLLV